MVKYLIIIVHFNHSETILHNISMTDWTKVIWLVPMLSFYIGAWRFVQSNFDWLDHTFHSKAGHVCVCLRNYTEDMCIPLSERIVHLETNEMFLISFSWYRNRQTVEPFDNRCTPPTTDTYIFEDKNFTTFLSRESTRLLGSNGIIN